jgi:hypothetical protein
MLPNITDNYLSKLRLKIEENKFDANGIRITPKKRPRGRKLKKISASRI